MKVITALVALTLTTTPAFANCATGNFIQVGDQTACIGQNRPTESFYNIKEMRAQLNRDREASKEKLAQLNRDTEARRAWVQRHRRLGTFEKLHAAAVQESKQNTEILQRRVAEARKTVLEPGGYERLEEAIHAYNASRAQDLMYERGL